METKNLIIICSTVVICVAIVVGAYVFVFNQTESVLTADIDSSLNVGDNFSVSLTDDKGNPLVNKNIILSFTNSKNKNINKTISTDKKGIATYKIDLPKGKYSLTCTFEDNGFKKSSLTKQITVKKSNTVSVSSIREEDKVVDGWNPKKHEVSREDIGDGNQRVTFDDGYFRIVDKNGNILSYGY